MPTPPRRRTIGRTLRSAPPAVGPAPAPPTDDRGAVERSPVDLSVDLAPSRPGALVLTTPLMAAAGCLGYGFEAADQIDIERLGAIVTRGTTISPRSGSPPPRMAEAPAGLLHAIGLQNPGIDAVLERFAPRWATWQVPVVLSICAAKTDDLAALAARADVPGVAALELDLASVDLTRDGRPLSLDAGAAARATEAARSASDLPLLVKLSPAANDVRAVARAVVDAGADALTCGGGLPAAAVDRVRASALLGGRATLSGPALRPVALRMVAEAAAAVKVPVIGCGGVVSIDDVVGMVVAGASAVQVGTALLADPELPLRLADQLSDHCERVGVSSHRDLVGTATDVSGRRRR
jgi:dihydroorotate dehydrogenase (NAD+) catalytic subunit